MGSVAAGAKRMLMRAVPCGLAGRFLRFCIVGLLNTALNYGVFYFLLAFLAAPYLVAGVVGFLAGAVTGFFLNRAWTFRAGHVGTRSGLFRYFLVQFVSLAGHMAALYLATEGLQFPPEVSQLVGIGVSTVLNFFLSQHFVFGMAGEASK